MLKVADTFAPETETVALNDEPDWRPAITIRSMAMFAAFMVAMEAS